MSISITKKRRQTMPEAGKTAYCPKYGYVFIIDKLKLENSNEKIWVIKTENNEIKLVMSNQLYYSE